MGQELRATSNETATIHVTEEASFEIRYYSSGPQLYSAHILSQKAAELEAAELEKRSGELPDERVRLEHQAYILASVFAAVAFLEAMINEVFLEADDPKDTPGEFLKQLPTNVITSMAQIWRAKAKKQGHDVVEFDPKTKCVKKTHLGLIDYLRRDKKGRKAKKVPEDVEMWSILNKFQLALYLTDTHIRRLPFDQNGPLWKDVALVIDLRNYLMHYKPEWITFSLGKPSQGERDETERLTRELTARKFNGHALSNSLIQGGIGFILEPLLGATCAMWAVNSCLSFACEFAARSQIDLPYAVRDLVSKRLNVDFFGCTL